MQLISFQFFFLSFFNIALSEGQNAKSAAAKFIDHRIEKNYLDFFLIFLTIAIKCSVTSDGKKLNIHKLFG